MPVPSEPLNVRVAKPLRKIVSTRLPDGPWTGRLMEVLECGHEQLQKTDIYGPTSAHARRCRQCVAKFGGPDAAR